MSNQTFEECLVKNWPAEPLEAHNVVVFERVGESGEKFRTILPPGTPLKRGLLDRLWPQGRFFAVAVDASPDLHLEANEHVVLEDEEAHRFELLLELYYSVSDPHLLASHRNRDPLRLIAKRARQLVGRDVRQLQWTEIVFSFAACTQDVVRNRLPELKTFAASYGIALRSLEVGRLLPEDATEDARTHEKTLRRINRKEEVGKAERESARRLADADSLHTLGGAEVDAAAQEARDAARIRAAAVDARIRAIGQVAGEVSTPAEFQRVFSGGVDPAGKEGGGARAAMLGGSGAHGALPAATSGLGGLLHQIVAATQNVGGSGKRLELRATLLHLIAEVLLEDLGDAAVCTRHADRARQLLATLNGGLAPEELDALKMLADPVALGKALRN
ncbi:MAG TPA: hypothetical protein VF710_15770 [Longimicrobium sp.]